MTSETYVNSTAHDLSIRSQESEWLDDGELILQQNIPNPWSENSLINVTVPIAGPVSFKVFDLHNRLIHEENRTVNKGQHDFFISRDDIPHTGVYFYEVEAGGMIARQKMIRVN